MYDNYQNILSSEHDNFIYFYTVHGEGVHIIKVYGNTPLVSIPDTIDGKKVTDIGEYCFSDKRNVVKFIWESEYETRDDMRLLAGDYISSVELSSYIKSAGKYAFYGCTEMDKIIIYPEFENIGSDAFMNCMKLDTIIIKASPDEKTGLKKILAHRTNNTTIIFENGKVDAKLMYPEYYEGYDEIGPAHIFQLNVEGEGFRARQCFNDGTLDFLQYDEVFLAACQSEEDNVLMIMAVNRLMYPYKLSAKNASIYTDYICEHIMNIGSYCIHIKDIFILKYLLCGKYDDVIDYNSFIMMASKEEWSEGTTLLINHKERDTKKNKTDRYSFD